MPDFFPWTQINKRQTMELRTKIVGFILSLIIGLSISAVSAYAASDDIKALTAVEYATEKGLPEDVIKALEKSEDGRPIIMCGKDLCDLSTQYCYYACSSYGYGTSNFGNTGSYCSSWGYSCYDQKKNGKDYIPCSHNCQEGDGLIFKGDRVVRPGSDGHTYAINIRDTATIEYADESDTGDMFRGCEVLPVKLYNYRDCFFCPLVGVIYDGSAKLVDTAFAKMAGSFAALMAIGFAIWVAIQVLGHLSSLTKQDAPKFLHNLLKQGYKFLIAFLLLQNATFVFKYVVNPLVDAGLEFGQGLLNTNYVFSSIDNDENLTQNRQRSFISGGQHYTDGTYRKIENYIIAIQREISFMQAIGSSLLCTGSNIMINIDRGYSIKDIKDGFQMVVQGLILAIFGFLLALAFTFYMIDAIVQLGVVGGLMPFMIAAWPFKATSKYTSTGVGMLLNSAFLFMFIGLVISVNIHLISAALANNTTNEYQIKLEQCLQDSFYKQNKSMCDIIKEERPDTGGLVSIAKAINAQQSDKLRELTDISGVGFLIIIFCSIFGFMFVNQAPALANKFASGGIGKPIAPSIATMGTSLAKNMALRATEETRDAISHKIDTGMEAFVTAPYRWGKAGYHKLRNKFSAPKEDDKGTSFSIPRNANSFAKAQNSQSTSNSSASGSAPTLNEGTISPASSSQTRPHTQTSPDIQDRSSGGVDAENEIKPTAEETPVAAQGQEETVANNRTETQSQSSQTPKEKAATGSAGSKGGATQQRSATAKQKASVPNPKNIKQLRQKVSGSKPKSGSRRNRNKRHKKNKNNRRR